MSEGCKLCGSGIPESRRVFCSEYCLDRYYSRKSYEKKIDRVRNEYNLSDDEVDIAKEMGITITHLYYKNKNRAKNIISEMVLEGDKKIAKMTLYLSTIPKEAKKSFEFYDM